MKTKLIMISKLSRRNLLPRVNRSFVPAALRIFTSMLLIVIISFFASCDNPIFDELEKALHEEKSKCESVPGPAQLLATLQGGASGSTIGPGGALYVTEPLAGRISRIDPKTGDVTTFAYGFPLQLPGIGVGGVWDVAFLGGTAYAIVMLVGPDVGGSDVVGIYRIDGPSSFTVIADIGAFSIANPPNTPFDVPTGVQYSIQTYHGAFLVADGHHNRVLHVTRDGEISEIQAFGNIVPTGLALSGNTIYLAQAGPIPHLPENGKVVSFGLKSPIVTTVASGARMLVDVEFSGRTLFALSQGFWDDVVEGTPAEPHTGSIVKVNHDGTFIQVVDGLDRPTSLEFIKNTAYIVSLTGEIWTIEDVNCPPSL